ncbi:TM0106 family RecB-like putative nuclease, partial [Opitutales bacterium]|nr:TM0106 family RecB-like putative nuclease [Opitutales bacterium]
MRKTKNGYTYSPSDLIRFMESPFASWMERFNHEKPNVYKKDTENEEKKLIAEAGDDHESAHLLSLKEHGKDVCEILKNSEAKDKTIAAIREKREIIFQPYFEMNGFGGYADFLKLNEDGQYEVWDTKLARSVKPYFLVQLCCYSEMLSNITGELPERIGIILGNHNEENFRTAEHFDYYLNLKKSFLEQMSQWNESNRPDPLPGAEHRDWSGAADNWMKEKDHLCLVASLRSNQVKKFNAAGINTVADLATTDRTRINGMSDVTLANLKEQARLQVETRKRRENESDDSPPLFEVRSHNMDTKAPRGLALLPPASPWDAYFDLEGFPLMQGGLEYLWGATHIDSGSPKFTDWWAHDHHEEEEAFIQFMDWAYFRWKKDPQMHIYHYAPYEITALKRIAGRCGKREEELDDLLRNAVFIDLYKVVRQGLLVGEGSYSIKKIERLYRPARDGDVSTSMGSVIAYADWIKSGEPDEWESSSLLRAIRDYNKDDCDSTWELAEWLRGLQKENAISHIPLVKD